MSTTDRRKYAQNKVKVAERILKDNFVDNQKRENKERNLQLIFEDIIVKVKEGWGSESRLQFKCMFF